MERSSRVHRRSSGILTSGLALSILFAMRVIAAPTEDGMFAVFGIARNGETLGGFTCRLEFEKTPQTVANFVGLAEGTQPWIDFTDGSISDRPFYDGITFHRVQSGFVIQAGSPNGLGNDGPGYTFRDEFVKDLGHDKAGILSMANSGANSNESQFFITLGPQPSLDGVHTVFGEVVGGMDVVNSIRVGDVIENVVIVRNGPSAESFDAAAPALPEVRPLATAIARDEVSTILRFDAPNAQVFTFESPDLETWNPRSGAVFSTSTETTVGEDVTPDEPAARTFFKQIAVTYPDELFTPSTVVGRRLTLSDVTGVTLALDFTQAATGIYTFDTGAEVLGPYSINAYTWVQEAYRGRMIGDVFNEGGPSLNGFTIAEADVSLVFSNPGSGTFAGVLIAINGEGQLGRITFRGGFTLEPL